jgi:hypothetical protein
MGGDNNMVLTAIFSDIHSCPAALEQVLSLARKSGVERFVSLGDIPGYGPDLFGCLEILEGRFYEKKTDKQGNASYVLVPNRYLLLGNHCNWLLNGNIHTPKVSPYARESIMYAWKQIGVDKPAPPGEAKKILDSIRSGVNLPKISRWRRFKDWVYGRSGRLSGREVAEVRKNMSLEDRAKDKEAEELEEQEKKFKPYYDFFTLLKQELSLNDNEKLMFAHAFPPSMAEYADQLGITKEAIDDLEVYVVKRDEWKDGLNRAYGLDDRAIGRLDAYVKNKSADKLDLGLEDDKKTQDIIAKRRTTAMAEEVVELLPEGFTLFLGHTHTAFYVDGSEGRRIINPGAVFNPRAKQEDEDFARFVLYDSTKPDNVVFSKIRYNRKKVNEEIRKTDLARFLTEDGN